MGWYEANVLPRCIDLMLGSPKLGKFRARATAGLSGTVVEIGFGSGLNVAHYPPAVDRVLAVDPAVRGRALARERLAASTIPVEFVGLEGEHLPLDDASVDHVLSTWTLCTIPGVEQALAEAHRVLKPGGRLHYLEHGLAEDEATQRWQRRLEPVQKRVAGGCHLTRPIGALVAGSGLHIESLERFLLKGPKSLGSMYQGTAIKLVADAGGGASSDRAGT